MSTLKESIHKRLTELLADSAHAPTPLQTIPSPDGRWLAHATLDPATDLLTWTIEHDVGGAREDRIAYAYPSGVA